MEEVSFYLPNISIPDDSSNIFGLIASFISFLVECVESAFVGALNVLEVLGSIYNVFSLTENFFSAPAWSFVYTMLSAIVAFLIWRCVCAVFF